MAKRKTDPKALLADAIDRWRQSEAEVERLWNRGPFRELLIVNLRSRQPVIDPPSEEFPRLRSYRGQGPHVKFNRAGACLCGECPEGNYHLSVDVDYVSAEISEFEEVEGCPGAPVQTERLHLSVPRALLQNTTQAAFEKWARAERKKHFDHNRVEARKTILALRNKFNL
jgi:hypothetical protein